ncbi:MAG: hypothetical protein ACMG57_03700 [Candidatus Dojkabacteria bacterium]
MDVQSELKFYKRHDIPLAHQFVEEDIDSFLPQIIELIRRLNPNLREEDLEATARTFAYDELFIVFYYYLRLEQPALALHYFYHFIKIDRGIDKYIRLLVPAGSLELKKPTVNVNQDQYERLFFAAWESIVNAIRPELDTNIILRQAQIVDIYQGIRSNLRGSADYLEQELLDLDGIIVNYINNEINLIQLTQAIEGLSVVKNRYVAYFLRYIQNLGELVDIPPEPVIVSEIKYLNDQIEEDELEKKFFRVKEPKVEDAFAFLSFYTKGFNGAVNIDNLALIYNRIEYHFRGNSILEEENFEELSSKYIVALKEAAKSIPELLGFDKFLDILATSKEVGGDYDIDKMTDPDLNVVVKGACVYLLIERARVKTLILKDVESYKPFIQEMGNSISNILEILRGINNGQIRFRAAVKIANLLAGNLIYGDILQKFLNNDLKKLIHNQISNFQKSLSYISLQDSVIKKWLNQNLQEN